MNFIYDHLRPVVFILIFSLSILILNEPIAIFAQDLGNVYMQSGIKKYNQFDINGAIDDLEKALSEGLKSKNQKIEAYKYMAFCYAEKGDLDESVKAFKNLLKIKRNFDLGEDPSPTHFNPFEQAKRDMKGGRKTWLWITGIVVTVGTILYFFLKPKPVPEKKLMDPPPMP